MKHPPIRSDVAALFQKKEEIEEKMAQQIQVDKASQAFLDLPTLKTWPSMVRHFGGELGGRIVALRWNRNAKGVSETIDMLFNDATAIRLIRFIPVKGTSCSLKLKRIEFK